MRGLSRQIYGVDLSLVKVGPRLLDRTLLRSVAHLFFIAQFKRQDELTRAIQERLANVRQKRTEEKDDAEFAAPMPSTSEVPPETPPSLADAEPATAVVQ